MTSKQRAYLRGLASTQDAILSLGKEGLTPEFTKSVEDALAARELIKISIQKNCLLDPREVADILAERLHAHPVQVIGRRFVLYRQGKDKNRKIVLPS